MSTLFRPAHASNLLLFVEISMLALLLWGCTKSTPPLQPRNAPTAQEAPAERRVTQATDAALRERLKSYVGLSVEGDANVRITIADLKESETATNLAREVWSSAFSNDAKPRSPRFSVIQAVAGPDDLRDAQKKMRNVLTLPGVVFLDLDEVCGCITVGIAVPSAETEVTKFAQNQGIRPGLVKTTPTSYVVGLADLAGDFRPTMGGVLIHARRTGSCTLGLPVWSFQRARFGFLTASHCTFGLQGGVSGAPDGIFYTESNTGIYQPDYNLFGNSAIGKETIDPELADMKVIPECPDGRRCRRSDSAFIDYDQDIFGITGRIARPNSTCMTAGASCGINMDRITDDIRIGFGISGLPVGTIINKVGVSSGWTGGAITRTCVDVDVARTDITLLCQYMADATSVPGDSGSPVFVYHAAAGAGEFAGILWGGSDDTTKPTFLIFSPLPGIESELGNFVYNQMGLTGAFASSGRFYTSDVRDELDVIVERNAVPQDQVEFVLKAGPGINQDKELVLVEGATAGTGRWTLTTNRNQTTSSNGLYNYQLPGGRLEFHKGSGNSAVEVSRVPIDLIPPGTRLTFTWLHD
jgi:hypothetical protein